MTTIPDVTVRNALIYGKKIAMKPNSVREKWEKASQRKNNEDKSRWSLQKAKQKRYRWLCQEQGTVQHGTTQPLKHVQGNKIIEEGNGAKKRPKESRSYQRLKRSCHKGTQKSMWKLFYGPNMEQFDYNELKCIKIQKLVMTKKWKLKWKLSLTNSL